MPQWSGRLRLRTYVLTCVGVILAALLVEHMMGRLTISKSGHIRLWASVSTSELSQQIADAYSFSHIIHGFAFYGLFYLLNRFVGRRKWPLGLCLLLAISIECTWEILENTNFIIDRYRKSTLSLDYYGDSVLNSLCDILFAALGFVLAARLPVWATIGLIIVMELVAGLAIRDNLTLNIIMLLHPVEGIKHWQMARGF